MPSVSFSIRLLSTCVGGRDASTLHLDSDVRALICVRVCVCLAFVWLTPKFLPFFFLVQLYDCSAGQSDCSQCRAVPAEYGCVWCPGSPAPSCVYNQSCTSSSADTCPPPQITQVSVLISLLVDVLGGHGPTLCPPVHRYNLSPVLWRAESG